MNGNDVCIVPIYGRHDESIGELRLNNSIEQYIAELSYREGYRIVLCPVIHSDGVEKKLIGMNIIQEQAKCVQKEDQGAIFLPEK